MSGALGRVPSPGTFLADLKFVVYLVPASPKHSATITTIKRFKFHVNSFYMGLEVVIPSKGFRAFAATYSLLVADCDEIYLPD